MTYIRLRRQAWHYTEDRFVLNGFETLACHTKLYAKYGGESGIRTHGPFRNNGFQDRRIRPLCHLSDIMSVQKKVYRFYTRNQ